MPRTIRFHFDENCDPRIALGLRRRGAYVMTTTESALLNASDESHLQFALANVRVIVTQDPDFLRIHAAGHEHPGIAFFPSASRSIGDVIRKLSLIWEVLDPEDMKNHVEFP